LTPPKHADRAFETAAKSMRDIVFPMSLAQAAWYVRARGCAIESRKNQVRALTQFESYCEDHHQELSTINPLHYGTLDEL